MLRNKVLIISYGFPPDTGGAEIVAYDYAVNLALLGYQVSVICCRHKDRKKYEKFEIIEIPNSFGKKFWMLNYYFFLKKVDYNKYDYIILNQSNTSGVVGRIFNKKEFDKCITIIQGFEVEWFYKNHRLLSNIFNNYIFRLKKFHKKTLCNSRKIVSVSSAHKSKVLNAAHLEHLSSKVQVVYTGIDKEVFYKVNDVYRDDKLKNCHILLSVSRIVAMKGYAKMLDIFKVLCLKDPTYHWMIAGDGPYLSELKMRVLEESLSENVTFLGNIERNSLKVYYSIADCFWLLSDYDECLPLVYLEAQACGTPAIGRNKGGVVETIMDNKTGFLVNSDEECLDILLHRKYERLKSEDLKSFIDKFDKVEAAKQLIS
ncbi:glycosyltransferase family 4 protein [uncultured Bacteroides sp.]|uniref:glycosyltransferase family 4 protein n=1 Tax=uncultured Bacteroides sp. TaxID=162156 RepID=UPI0025EEAB55|nr:glycosyltransferase family 4 protein [uncultured Bacteroides sp.]